MNRRGFFKALLSAAAIPILAKLPTVETATLLRPTNFREQILLLFPTSPMPLSVIFKQIHTPYGELSIIEHPLFTRTDQ